MAIISASSILRLSLLIIFFLPAYSPAFSEATIPSLIQEGNNKFNQSKYEESGRYFREALEREPKNIPALLGLSSALSQLEQYPETARELKTAIQLSPRNIFLYLWLAHTISAYENNSEAAREFRREFRPRLIELWFENDYRRAISDFREITNQYPNSAWALELLGKVFLKLGLNETARGYYEEAARRAPDWESPLIALNLRPISSDLTTSVNNLNHFLQQHPDLPMINFNLGFLYRAQELPEQARAAFQALLDSDLTNRSILTRAHLQLCRSAIKRKDYREALAQFNQSIALSSGSILRSFPSDIFQVIKEAGINPEQYRKQFQQDPENILLAYFLARRAARENDYDESIRLSRRTIDIALLPRDRLRLSYHMIPSPGKAGEINKLIEDYCSRIKKEPQNAENYLWLAGLYTRQARSDEAIKILEDGLDLTPGANLLRARLASLYLKQGQYEKAIAEYRGLIDKIPLRLKYYGYLSDCYFKTGQTDQGREILNKLCRSFPREAIAWTTAGNIYQKNGLLSDAASAYSSALNIRPGDFIISLKLAKTDIKLRQYSRAGEIYQEAIKRCGRPKLRRSLRKKLVNLYSDTG
ncbi:MAG TPA: tetratricopeptide repeat protein, partial [Proteobacteria bacterium]|nr:tetratricopeptide repeat protein [Pseudomonadota bacterium]